MAKYLNMQYAEGAREEAKRQKVDEAPYEHATALLKLYDLLNAAEKHRLLDVLKGAITAEDTIIDKVAGYANTPEGITTMRNLMIMGKLFAGIDPDLLKEGANDLTSSVIRESSRRPQGFFATTRRLFGADALRGLGIAIAGLESIGKTAKRRTVRQP